MDKQGKVLFVLYSSSTTTLGHGNLAEPLPVVVLSYDAQQASMNAWEFPQSLFECIVLCMH